MLAALSLSSCGGGGSAAAGSADTTGLPQRPAARLEIAPAALMLTALGERQQLQVRAFDADGVEVRADVVWKSSRPEQVATSAGGMLEALTALGASQITVEANGVRSAPVLVSVALPAAGVVLVRDNQVVAEPTLVDPAAVDDTDNPYEVVLSGIALPAPGTLMLGREGKTIGGEVISARAEGNDVRVQLRIVPITTLMQTAQIHEVLDFTGLTPEFPAELRDEYDIAKVDDEFVFTPKPGRASKASATGRKRPATLTEFKLGPYKCDFATPELPVSLAQPAQFSMKFEPSYQIDYDNQTGLQKMILRADTAFKTKAQLTLSAGGLLNIDCAAPLYTRLMPLPGWAGLILTGEVKAGLGFELEGNLTIPLLGVELTSETKGRLEMGLDCASGECRMVRNYDPVNTNKLRFITPDAANLRTDVFVFGYGFAKLKAGATLLDKLRMDLVTVRSGLKLEGSFAPPTSQLAPADSDYKSDYKLSFLTEIVAGSINKAGDSAFRKLLLKLGIFKFNLLKFQNSVPMASSPKGTATRDRSFFVDGDTLAFDVRLDPATVEFPFVGYNVARVLIMRAVPGQPAREVARVDAADGQARFDLAWRAEGTAGETGGEFFAFVETRLPTPFKLELGKATAVPLVFSGRLVADFDRPAAESEFTDGRVVFTRISGERIRFDADIEFDEVTRPRVLRKNASIDSTGTRLERRAVVTRGCSFIRTDESSFASARVTGKVFEGDAVSLETRDGAWRLNHALLVVPGASTTTTSRRFTDIAGDCSAFDTTDVPPTDTTVEVDEGTQRFLSFVQPVAIALTRPITTDPDGRRAIRFSGDVPQLTGHTLTVTLDLKEGPSQRALTDLELSLIAPPFTEAEAPLTYAVNLTNKSANAASEVRAEFSLPAGFAIVGTTGWQGCSTLGTTAICTADGIAPGETRAFLVDVKAPAAGGRYTVKARVSSLELDANFADNHVLATTEISD